MADDTDEGRHSVIRYVSGRDAAGGERGLPKLANLELALPDGSTWVASAEPEVPAGEGFSVEFACSIPAGQFEFCPICYERPADSVEHVPPQNLGGSPLTVTCRRCNNIFGTRVERDLQDWFDRVVTMQVRTGDNPKPVSSGRAHVLFRRDGAALFIPERGSRLDFGLSQGQPPAMRSTWRVREPSLDRVRIALLKSAYLAASMYLGGVPDVASAGEIRSELLRVIGSKDRAALELGAHGAGLQFWRTGQPVSGSKLALFRRDDGGGILISLAGTLLVSWPFAEIDPEHTATRIRHPPQ